MLKSRTLRDSHQSSVKINFILGLSLIWTLKWARRDSPTVLEMKMDQVDVKTDSKINEFRWIKVDYS